MAEHDAGPDPVRQNPTTTRLRILVAEDNDTDRMILQKLVRRLGHDVITARDGMEAVERYQAERPEMVLLDVLMPALDGNEAARQIKKLAGETLVPVIFLTSLSDPEELARCLASGGDDFLSKPYNRVIIEAKIRAFERMRQMHQTLTVQRDLIRARNEQLISEQQVARRVFDNVAHRGCLGARSIRYHCSPLSVFNGDILFACPRPAGGVNLLIGDFTGHGLPAAIGAMPVAEIFYGMTGKGFSAGDILREINQKLTAILTTDLFCCAAFVEAESWPGRVRIWNGGLPDGYLIRRDGRRMTLPSEHLPLGVVSPERFCADMTAYDAKEGDTVVFATDGVMEASTAQGEAFGEQRLMAALDDTTDDTAPFDRVIEALRAFMGGREWADDLTIVSLDLMRPDDTIDYAPLAASSGLPGPPEWDCQYTLTGESLRQFNPLPLLLHICLEVPGLQAHSGDIYIILSELYTNALEHGILTLPSDWKRSASGFGQYYAEREKRLRTLSGGEIAFRLHHRRLGAGGELVIECQDSGDGFAAPAELSLDQTEYAGRGLALIHRLCQRLEHIGKGNHVAAIYRWPPDQGAQHDRNTASGH
ncbi:histidine kinase-like protein [Tamilnaduibacter salinus]|uniref:Histidine kinase-like protein n=1 Tax=Tamilnaduibacter salinus TaxID=1484056 RepID=A0A2U1D1J5_9GAMM|nr:fused response regulator/phosphatase [Tamilnaduibacter salinus]PVY79252.1 histidine kinase-like protein [Tamilnaduibacter salinus]